MSFFDFGFSDIALPLGDRSMTDEAKQLALQYFQKDSLIKVCKNAIELVKADGSLIKSNRLRSIFISQSPKRAAKSLCTTIVRYIYLKLNNCDVPSFELYWIKLVNDNVYSLKRKLGPDRKVFTYYSNEHLLIRDYLDVDTYTEMFKPNMLSKKIKLLAKGLVVQVVMCRNLANTHTFLCVIEMNAFTRIDTYHRHKLGKIMKGVHRWMYWYRDGVNI